MFDAVASLLARIADAYPLILVLDDLHWADVPTLALLRHVARFNEQMPALLLGTYRETEVDHTHPLAQALAELRRARMLDTLRIQGLGEEEVAQLISARVGREPPAIVARSIRERTEGNPFFVEEVLREAHVQDDWSAAIARMGVPETVKDLILRRLRRLDAPCRRLLAVAAVSGREFPIDVLEKVCGMPAHEVAESLESAIAARVVEESPGSIGAYTFAHALIRETIYEQLSQTRRAQLHRLIGEAIETSPTDAPDERASTLAHHFSAAGDVAKGYEYHARAAAVAYRVYAIEPALVHHSAAIDAGERLGHKPDGDPAIRRLLLQRGWLRYRTGDDAGAGADFGVALDAARRSGDRVTEMETLNALGLLALRSDLAGAVASHEAALEIAEELGDKNAQTQALDRLSVVSSHLLELDRGLCAVHRIGPALVFERLWEETGCRAVISELAGKRKHGFALERAVFLTVLHRLFVSGSDRAADRWREDYAIAGVEGLDLHHLYRAMAWLGEELPEKEQDGRTPFAPRCVKDVAEERLFAHRRDLLTRLDLVFMDTTSLYFEGAGGQTLGQHGYSKDHRSDLRQMILTVLIDGDGRPVCSEMWPGNTADVTTAGPSDRPAAPALRYRARVRGRRSWHDQR